MLMQENYQLKREIIDLLQAEYKIYKPMPHLTELIYCLRRSYWDRVEPVLATDKEILLFAVGWGLERLLLARERKITPGVVDGIHYSPDLLTWHGLPGELKTTRQSMKKIKVAKDLPETWVEQILGYMHCLYSLEYELAVLYLMGSYSPPFPELLAYRLTADEDEVVTNWEYLLRRRAIYLYHMEEKTLPEKLCKSWECDLCRYKIRCTVEAR